MAENEKELTWTTWEELLLGCAVKRHGLQNWDSVAMELQTRSSLPLLLTAQVCRNKYHDLKRRFMDQTDHQHDKLDNMPWLEELRKLRVAELKQEVHRYDLSIHSLQLKVKRLEEERERSLKENGDEDKKPDLAESLEVETSASDKKDRAGPREAAFPNHACDEGSNRENGSFNESNSTENRRDGEEEGRKELEPVETSGIKPDPVPSESKPAGEDSYNDSTDTIAKQAAAKPSQELKVGDPSELRDSASESRERTVESSEVQSFASLRRKRRRQAQVHSHSNGGGSQPVVSPATSKREAEKSEPLIWLLDIIRSHKHGSMFERRLESQKTDEYNKMIRHHMDIETIRSRINNGSYSSWAMDFYRDLILLFNNAIVFFPKASTESAAACELRDLVLQEIERRKTQRSASSPEPAPLKPDPERTESLLSKHRPSTPIIVCRRRSSISAKVSTANAKAAEKQTDNKSNLNPKPPHKSSPNVKEEQNQTRLKAEEKPVTGARSLRGNGKGRLNGKLNTRIVASPSSNNAREASRTEKKAEEALKKRGAADFLKRIKQNSLSTKAKLSPGMKNRETDATDTGKKGHKEKMDGRKPTPMSKRSGGGGGRKQVIEKKKKNIGRPLSKGKGAGGTKRRRESGGAEIASKQPKKRQRR